MFETRRFLIAHMALGLAIVAGQVGCGGANSPASGTGGHATGSGGAGTGGAPGGSGGAGTGGAQTGSGGVSGTGGASTIDAGGGTSGADAAPGDSGQVITNPPDSVVWLFDNLKTVGTSPSYNLAVSGAPMVIDTPEGKAVQFNGTNDTLEVSKNPVDVWPQWTVEVIFRIDTGGAQAQRWFHIAGTGGMGTGERVLFELRYDAAKDTWFQVAFVQGGATGRLFGWNFPHPAGKWYHVAIVIDGKTMKPYVNGVWEPAGNCAGEACTPPNLTAPFPLAYKQIGPGGTRVGSRYGGSAYLKGAVRMARFTPRALTPAEFLPNPEP
jgi:Concanavalin A-like lectin/glucanases superfamily